MMAAFVGEAVMIYYKQLMEILETSADLKKMWEGICSQMAWAARGTCVGGVVAGHPGALVGGIVGICCQMAWAARGTCAGGVVAGPRGALVGGIVGAVYGYYKSDDYDSMLTTVRNLTDYAKERLVKKIQGFIGSATLEALKYFVVSQGVAFIKYIQLVL